MDKFKVGDKIFACKRVVFTADYAHEFGDEFRVTADTVRFFNKNNDKYKLIPEDSIGMARHIENTARCIIKHYDNDYVKGMTYAVQTRDERNEGSEKWQYWNQVVLKIWRKYCGVALRDRREKPFLYKNAEKFGMLVEVNEANLEGANTCL